MLATVAICTWNRADLLDKTLERMRELVIPDGMEWELLVVDNKCTDHTQQVIARHAGALPLRCLVEREQGLSHARNRCLREASGDWLLWVDDDVLVSPDWLAQILAAIEAHPDAAFVGGTVEPWFEHAPPPWVERNLDMLQGAYAIRRLGPGTRWLAPGELPYGANFGVNRRSVGDRAFNPALGVRGDTRVCGEETELLEALVAAGGKGLWVGEARVQHFVPADRLCSAYVKKVARGYGYGLASRGAPGPTATVFGRPRWAVARYLRHRLLELISSPLRSRLWLASLQQAAIHAGVISAFHDQAHGGNRAH